MQGKVTEWTERWSAGNQRTSLLAAPLEFQYITKYWGPGISVQAINPSCNEHDKGSDSVCGAAVWRPHHCAEGLFGRAEAGAWANCTFLNLFSASPPQMEISCLQLWCNSLSVSLCLCWCFSAARLFSKTLFLFYEAELSLGSVGAFWVTMPIMRLCRCKGCGI